MKQTTIILQPNGRLVLPVKIRQVLDLEPGQRLSITVDGGRIVLTPQIERLRQAQALLSEQVLGDDSLWSEKLIAERRAEAERE